MTANVTIWNEYRHERHDEEIGERYPDGIHGAIADGLDGDKFEIETATFDEPEHGLTESLLDWTDVLFWWGHDTHDEVDDGVVQRVKRHVLDGTGLVVLHSGQGSKIFTELLGTTGEVKWRNAGERERLWVIDQGHPIADGLDEYIEIPEAATYGEPFDVPEPDSLVFVSWFEGGEVFRSGCCYRRGKGRIFYFRPGDEAYPIYRNEDVHDVLNNAAGWAAQREGSPVEYGEVEVPPEASE
jgi:trehalose utilization protein